jgi:hypothetical protein
LCSYPDPSLGVASLCHRNYHTPIDTGFLDEEIPDDERKDAMMIEEIKDDAQEEDNKEENQQEEQRLQALQNNWASLPATHRQLLTELGFVHGAYEVTDEQMQASWVSCTAVEYLTSLNLSHLANRGNKLKTVRKATNKLLQRYNLRIEMRRRVTKGKTVSTCVVVTTL